jgi:hypothetical protein
MDNLFKSLICLLNLEFKSGIQYYRQKNILYEMFDENNLSKIESKYNVGIYTSKYEPSINYKYKIYLNDDMTINFKNHHMNSLKKYKNKRLLVYEKLPSGEFNIMIDDENKIINRLSEEPNILCVKAKDIYAMTSRNIKDFKQFVNDRIDELEDEEIKNEIKNNIENINDDVKLRMHIKNNKEKEGYHYIYNAVGKIELHNIKHAYKWLIKQIELLKEYTDDKIDLLITGWIPDTIRYMLNYYANKLNIIPSKITYKEYEFLKGATRGYYILSKNPYNGEIFEYDQKSSFPYVLLNQYFNIPIGEPKFHKGVQQWIDNYMKTGKIDYGIYRCVIKKNNKIGWRFQYNEKNYYTHIDLMIARDLKLKVQLIEDGNDNIMQYKGCISSKKVFGKYIDWIYQLKEQHKDCLLFKPLISHFHGVLLEMKKFNRYCEIGGEIEEPENYIQVNEDLKGNYIKIEYIDKNNLYKSQFARAGVFIYSSQRKWMFENVINKYYDDIVYFRSDGFYSKKPIEEFKNSCGTIGDVVFKGKKYI